MNKIICILLMWVVVVLFMIKQVYDNKKYPNKPKIILYITWSLMILVGLLGIYFTIIK